MTKKAVITGVAALLLLGGATIYRFYFMRARNAVEDLIQRKKIINILIAGGNAESENKHSFYAVASINPQNNRIGVTFIPPSFRIRIDDDEYSRIDQVPAFNYNRIRHSLQMDLGLSIPFYIEIHAKGAARIIDLIEGVDLFLLDQSKEDAINSASTAYFDGGMVVNYINRVEQNSIYLKYDRILDVLLTLYGNREGLERFIRPDFVKEAMKSITTNLLPQEIMRIAEIVMNDGDLMFTVVPGVVKDGYYIMDDITLRIYQKEFISNLIVERSEREIDASIKIKILNATDVPGLARKMREGLIRDGLNVVEFGTASSLNLPRSVIVNRKASFGMIRRVAELTGINTICHVIDSTQLCNVMVLIGSDRNKQR